MATDIIARGMITEYIAGTNINFTENRDGTVEISASGSISSEDSVARDAIGNHKSDTSNPHNVTPAQIGLGNVDNTSDLDKPISTAVQKAIDNKADKTVATTSADGLMSAEDKGKLDGIATGANRTVIDTALSSTSINPVQNKVVTSALAGKAANSHTHSDYALKTIYENTSISLGRKADTTIGGYSVAEGQMTTASGLGSHAEGGFTIASVDGTHAEGWLSTASGHDAHAEGYETTASGSNSHSEGRKTVASGMFSHAEGDGTTASGESSHAEGSYTTASGVFSHSGGKHTKALHNSEVAYGKYNESNDDTLFSIGDGTSDSARHNAFEITTTGGKLHDKDIATTDKIPDLSAYAKKSDIPTELPANGGNADTVGDFDAYHMGTTTYDGTHYPPEQFPVYCQYNTYDDGRFAFLIDSSYQPENSYEVRCDYASNSGNADTLGKKSISDFIYAHGYYTGNVDDIKYPFSGIVINATGIPPQTSVWGTMLCYGGGTGSFAQIWVSNDDNATMFVRHSDGNRWTEWSGIYASGNKPYITGSATVEANSNVCVSNHGFTPSAVIWWDGSLSGVAVSFSDTKFTIDKTNSVDRTINYLMFK